MDRRILVVDDSEATCQQVSRTLARAGRQIKIAHDVTAAMEWLIEGNFSLVLTDLRMPGLGGLELLREIRFRNLPVTVIVMSGHATIDTAVEAMKLGAYDYLRHPLDPVRLEMLVEKSLEDRKLQDEVAELRLKLRQVNAFHNLHGRSAVMQEIFHRISRVAASSCPVLICGETGTGKERVAQAIHYADPLRREGPLVIVGCTSLSDQLLESELFGHERGAFTGADRQRKGRFEQAQGGTLLLDEVGDFPHELQAKLLRVLQEGTFERVGGTETIRTNARILATTQHDLGAMVAAGRFREDLFYRLNVVTIALPPLRDRIEDLPLLVEQILANLQERGYPPRTISRPALALLSRMEWPGNVRQLENEVETMIWTTPGPAIEAENVPTHLVATRDEPFSLDFDPTRPLPEICEALTERIERTYLVKMLRECQGRIDRCAARSGLSRRSISEKLRRYRIDKAEFKVGSTTTRRLGMAPLEL